jgi:hypothetical protein
MRVGRGAVLGLVGAVGYLMLLLLALRRPAEPARYVDVAGPLLQTLLGPDDVRATLTRRTRRELGWMGMLGEPEPYFVVTLQRGARAESWAVLDSDASGVPSLQLDEAQRLQLRRAGARTVGFEVGGR